METLQLLILCAFILLQSEYARPTYPWWQRILLGLYLPVLRKIREMHEGHCDPLAGISRQRQGQDFLQAPGTALVRSCAYYRDPGDSPRIA